MNTLNKTLITLVTGAMLTTGANAAMNYSNSMTPTQAYVGVKAGQIDIDVGSADKATAYGVYGGYNFDNNFGVEAEYVASGDADIKLGASDAQYDVKSFGAYGTYRYNFPNTGGLYAKGKVGVAATEIKATTNNGFSSAEVKETGLAGGLGLGYNITNNIAIEGEYDMLATGDTDASLLTIGAHLKF